MFLDGSPNFKVGAAFSFDPPKLIRAKLIGVIADAAALKAMFEWKGASGLKPCIECDNLWMKNSRIELANAVTFACFDSSLYEKRSDEDVWESYDTLQAQLGIVGVGFFKNLEQGCGLKLVPGSLLEDVELRDVVRPVSHKIDDWPHVFFQSGLFNVEFRLLLDRCEEKETNIGWHTFRDCSAADWKFPKDHAAVNRSLSKAMFSEAREKACANSIRFRITESIIAFPVIRFVLDTLAHDELRAETASWRALCDMIDAILAIKKGCNVDRPSLGKMQPKHMKLFVDIYGESNLIPKHHSPYHVFKRLLDDLFIPDALSLERKHQKAKAFGEVHLAALGYEEYVLVSCMMHQRRQLMEEKLCDNLVRPQTAVFADGIIMEVASQVKWRGATVSAEDVIVLLDCAIYVRLIGFDGEKFYIRGQRLVLRSMLTPNASEWLPGDEMVTELDRRTIKRWPYRWTWQADGSALVLHGSWET
jgi:hypothetical protein